MVSVGLPRSLAANFASFDAGIAQGVFAPVSDAFEALTGRKPIRIADFLANEGDALLQESEAR